MAQKLTVDLKKNPAVADVVADLQVGDRVKVMASIATKDEQTLTLELEEVVEEGAPDEAPEVEENADEDGDGAE